MKHRAITTIMSKELDSVVITDEANDKNIIAQIDVGQGDITFWHSSTAITFSYAAWDFITNHVEGMIARKKGEPS